LDGCLQFLFFVFFYYEKNRYYYEDEVTLIALLAMCYPILPVCLLFYIIGLIPYKLACLIAEKTKKGNENVESTENYIITDCSNYDEGCVDKALNSDQCKPTQPK
jgi:hypothetical protein